MESIAVGDPQSLPPRILAEANATVWERDLERPVDKAHVQRGGP